MTLGSNEVLRLISNEVRIQELLMENYSLREKIVYGFYEEGRPSFHQGIAGEHELTEPVTANQVTNWFNELERKRKQFDHMKNALEFYASEQAWQEQFNVPGQMARDALGSLENP